MAAVIGNVALLLDVAVVDVVLNLPIHRFTLSSNKPLEYDGKIRIRRFLTRGKANSRANAVDFNDAGSNHEESGEGGGSCGGGDEEEKAYDVKKEMKRRAKELHDMKELERKAEELQYEMDEECEEDSEEKKRMRVKRELEKIRLFSVIATHSY